MVLVLNCPLSYVVQHLPLSTIGTTGKFEKVIQVSFGE